MADTEFTQVIRHVRTGWTPAHIYNDAAVFEAERNSIFERSWLFLAHAAEIPDAGDYVVRRVVDDSFIVVRGEDGRVRVFFNMCLHRGMQVCRAERGNASHFRCPYHAWSYRNDGRLIGVPFHAEAYGGDSVLRPRDHSLLAAPATETIDDLIFVSLNPDVEPLQEFLGQFADYLHYYTLLSPAGVEVRGPQRWRSRSNWKIGAENFSGDMYHTPHTHVSAGEIGLTPQNKAGARRRGITYCTERGMGAAFAVGPGDLGATLDGLGYPPAQVENRLRCWPSRIKAMIADGGQLPSAATLFPNLSLLHTWAAIHAEGTIAPFTTMRVWQPISESETEILSWFLVDRDAEPEFKKASYKAYIMCFGPSGMLEQDDMENWVSLTQTAGGRMARRLLLNNRMGLREDGSQTREPLKDFPGPGEAREGFNEHNQRQWLRLWSECIDAERPVSAPCPTMR